MDEQHNDIDSLLSDAGDYIETRTNLWKLKGIESLVDVSSELVTGLGLICILGVIVVMFSVGVSLLVGDWLGKSYYGFFIVGTAYVIFGLVCYIRRGRWMKAPFANMLIRKILK